MPNSYQFFQRLSGNSLDSFENTNPPSVSECNVDNAKCHGDVEQEICVVILVNQKAESRKSKTNAKTNSDNNFYSTAIV